MSGPEKRLSRRQYEVAELVAQGLTNREIADRLFISERTAEGHVQSIFNVLSLNTRSQIASWWVRHHDGRSGQSSASPGRVRSNLPAPLTKFIDRERELAELRAALRERRLVSLVGVGGGGKTRLALQLGAELLDDFEDGVWLVELAALSDPLLIPQAVARAIHIEEQPSRPLLQTLADRLSGEERLLLVDNCEHLLDGVAQVVAHLLGSCSRLRILITSRERLGMPAELVYRVETLAYPDEVVAATGEGRLEDGDRLSRYPAIRLFVERAQAVEPGFRLTEANAAEVAQVCARLDGIPLALELAAAWVHSIGIDSILGRLDHRLRLLGQAARGLPARHQTLAATIDWSYAHLSDPERRLFRRLAVLRGPFRTRDGDICVLDGEQIAVEDVIPALVEKSLVARVGARHRMLETIREYAWEQLRDAGEAEIMVRRHAERFASSLAEKRSGEMAAWLDAIDADLPNLRAALAWSLEHDARQALRMAGHLLPYWQLRGHLGEARRFVDPLLQNPALSPLEGGQARVLASMAAYLQNDLAVGRRWAEEALSATQPDPALLTQALRARGQIAMGEGDLVRAEACFEEQLQLSREEGATEQEAVALHHLAQVMGLTGRLDEARSLFARSVAIKTELGEREEAHISLAFVALAHLLAGEPEAAEPVLQESLEFARRLGDRRAAWTIGVRACVWGARGDSRRAVVLAAAALALHRSAGTAPPEIWNRLTQAWLEPARQSLGSESSTAEAEGSAMDFEAALAYALDRESQQSTLPVS